MSRSHLYRMTGPSRPLLSLVAGAVWLGAGLLVLLATAPDVAGGVPLHGPAAAIVERTFALLAGGAVLAGAVILAAEVVVGRTGARGVRVAGAVLLLLAGGWGLLGGAAGRLLRPGTPAIAEAATGDTVVPAESERLATQRVLWSSAALVGALLVVGGALTGVRDRGL